ncbi:MAG: SurA N-terminal domain-containing protein [Thermodesulfobacteriota bacterium]
MLDLIRKKQKTFIVKFVFWVIIAAFIGTIFLVWGKGQEQEDQLTVAARVNDTKISFDEFRMTYNNLYNLYRNLYGDSFSPEMEEELQLNSQSMNMLIEQALLIEKAEEMGLEVSKDEVVSAIAAVEAFQVDGSFDKDRYVEVLNYQRMTPKDFEEMQRRQMLVNRVRAQIQGQVQVTDADVVEEYRRINEKINLAYLAFDPRDFRDEVEVDAAAVEKYYAENKEQYRIGEQVALEYVEVSAEDLRDEIEPSEEDLERYYQRHMDEFSIDEQVQARHIFIRVPQDASDEVREKKRAQAQEILTQVDAESFATIAKQKSDDAESAAEGGDLGYFKRNTFDSTFEKVAFSLETGEISDVVEGASGFHIVQVTDHVQAGYKPLDQVRSQVAQGFIKEQSVKLAYEKAIDAYNMNREQGGIVGAAQQLGLSPLKSGLLTRDEPIGGIGNAPELKSRAFSASEGKMIKPLKVGDKVVLAQVTEQKSSYIPELDQVRPRVVEKVRQKSAEQMAMKRADQALEGLQDGTAIDDVATEAAELDETGLFAHNLGGVIPGIGPHEELTETAFSLSIKEPLAPEVYQQDNVFYVVKLKQIQPADPSALSQEESDALEAQVRERKQEKALQEVIDEMRADADITIAPSILNSMKEE